MRQNGRLPPLASKKVRLTVRRRSLQVVEELLRNEKIGRVLVLADGTTYDQEIERALAASGVVPVVRAALPSKGEIEGFDLIVAQNEYEQLEALYSHRGSAKYILLGNVNADSNRYDYSRLLESPYLCLVDYDLRTQSGYANFQDT